MIRGIRDLWKRYRGFGNEVRRNEKENGTQTKNEDFFLTIDFSFLSTSTKIRPFPLF